MESKESNILNFIKIFQSDRNKILFSDVACYYFASILRARYPISDLMYNPHSVHFAVRIGPKIYDISGEITGSDSEEYMTWEEYSKEYEDADDILYHCFYL